jgi:hypothetical protein
MISGYTSEEIRDSARAAVRASWSERGLRTGIRDKALSRRIAVHLLSDDSPLGLRAKMHGPIHPSLTARP